MSVVDGLLVVDKPAGWTSHDVVARSRRLCRTRKVGHAGTLDPMATGVLVLGVGRGTRMLTHLVSVDKTYTATIRLGQATVTDDAEGEVTATVDASGLDPADLDRAVAALTGDILQVPSAVSAIKVDGERSYARVRAGEDVVLPARPVRVSELTVRAVRPQALQAVEGTQVLDVDIVATVSSGTYVRALARDLGASLGVGGHLTALRRTRVGRFGLDRATALDAIIATVDEGGEPPTVPLAQAAAEAFAVRQLSEQEATAISYGQRIPLAGSPRADIVAGIAPDGRLVALLDESGDTARSAVVFASASS